ncbi:HAD-IIA family hydrolase [[Mycobacterium] burgundiense]|uniref:HAD-IIA family hydrolase n=1 Tax=[Mycobacterium] burgundiense TaxID=3064286 RepID=A0ABM9LPS4_9MYCO|nr:HAD-IIA family hydrolase [Mycolicibacterium sp. MU0053]CAJ1502645.1 HAD-IIA family hydrolase [Mycolicibacterium sp. MU0053]
MSTLAQLHDCLLLDLDGTVFRGHAPTDGAVEALAAVTARQLFVTNNASRSAEDVAAHLRELGFAAVGADVVTSAQSAAGLLAEKLPGGAHVLVVGTEALADEVSAVGLVPVRMFADDPVAVVQGHSVDTGWAQLAEAALAVRAGALWVAANVDKTLPSERGLLPGNGSMVAALQTATDAVPLVAGKPAPTLMTDALSRGRFHAPLVVGDRLDTDIAGANAASLPSLMVLTGVSTAREAVHAVPEQRPTHIAATLTGLHAEAERLAVAAQPGWRVTHDGPVVRVEALGPDVDGDGLAVVRATAHAIWASGLEQVTIEAADDIAEAALRRWSLLDSAID